MKIGIVTMSFGVNYGNKLQNYAVSRVLSKLGADTETLKYSVADVKISYMGIIKQCVKILLGISKRKPHISKKTKSKRYERFEKFNDKIKMSSYSLNEEITEEIVNYYDYFVCGSDQIWNPGFHSTGSEMFLSFAPSSKKISYSASFGVNSLPEEKEIEYAQYLKDFKAISVREQEGVNIVRKIIERDAQLLVDPTMMLTKEEWMEIEKKPVWHRDKPYIFTYYLGNKSKETELKIKELQNKKNLDIVELYGEYPGNSYKSINKYWYTTTPDEFVWLIRNADIIFTDSFHACVFSMLMKKPFVVSERKDSMLSMESRITTLLQKFGLERRRENNIDLNNVFEIDYKGVDDILIEEREKSINYLRKALEINEA